MPGRIDFSLDFNRPATGSVHEEGKHYRIYILGDFSGRADSAWEQRHIQQIDIDNFDRVMAKIGPTLELDGGRTLSFEMLDDFHPDVWLQKIPILADLIELKRQLSNPATAEQAAAKIKAYLPGETPASLPEGGETREEMLERLLGKKTETRVAEPDVTEQLIRQIVSPYVSKDTEPEHQSLTGVIDGLICRYLCAVLHRSDFQGLEALWLATAGLVNEESADGHSFFLVDIGQNDLLGELRGGRRVLEQKLAAHIQFGDAGQDVLLVGDYRFSEREDDLALLGLCSRLASNCNACFFASPDALLVENVIVGASEKWERYRREISADSVVLAYPRYLLRLPYGNKRDPLETLEFEELSGAPGQGELLWGNPAFLCARVLLRAGGEHAFDDLSFFGDVPAFTFEAEGGQILQPGAESVITENRANMLLSNGVMPLIGYHQRQGVRLIALSTLAVSY